MRFFMLSGTFHLLWADSDPAPNSTEASTESANIVLRYMLSSNRRCPKAHHVPARWEALVAKTAERAIRVASSPPCLPHVRSVSIDGVLMPDLNYKTFSECR